MAKFSRVDNAQLRQHGDCVVKTKKTMYSPMNVVQKVGMVEQ